MALGNTLPEHGAVDVFEAHYAGLPGAGWEIGRPQAAFVALADEGAITGRVLDVGCGSGDNALMLAERGLPVTGVDGAPSGVALARRKAQERGLDARFLVHDVLRLAELGERFDTVIDCGLFHCFTDDLRPALAASLHAALVPGGRYVMLVFSDAQEGDWGPRRVSEDAVRTTFTDGWRIDRLERTVLEVAFGDGHAQAWLAHLTRR